MRSSVSKRSNKEKESKIIEVATHLEQMQTIQALLLKNKQIEDSKSKKKEESWKDALNQLS